MIIDNEFKALIPPLTADEKQGLESRYTINRFSL